MVKPFTRQPPDRTQSTYTIQVKSRRTVKLAPPLTSAQRVLYKKRKALYTSMVKPFTPQAPPSVQFRPTCVHSAKKAAHFIHTACLTIELTS